VLNMTHKYRAGAVPHAGTADDAADESADAPLVERIDALPAALADAYARTELQQCVLLPIELARAANAYIDVTRPFSLAKGPARASRLDRVLTLSLRATQLALASLVPVLPVKAIDGLRQLGIDPREATLDALQAPLPAGHALGAARVLFPRVDEPTSTIAST
jgi:methionyl-tRNA synthetase